MTPRSRGALALALLFALLSACGDDGTLTTLLPGGADADADAGEHVDPDAVSDADRDAVSDADPDAGRDTADPEDADATPDSADSTTTNDGGDVEDASGDTADTGDAGADTRDATDAEDDADDAQSEDAGDAVDVGDVLDAGATDARGDIGDAADDALDVLDSTGDAAADLLDTDTPEDTADIADVPALPPVDPADVRAPPYLMWVTEDSVTVKWETSSAVVGHVRYGRTEGLGREVVEPAAVTNHEVRLTGLRAGSTVHYEVGWDGRAWPRSTFRTAPIDDRPISFVVWGDNQNGPDTFSDLVDHMAELDPDFMVSVGDIVQNGTRGEYRSQLLRPIHPAAARSPFLVAGGNHERYSDSSGTLFDEYMAQPGDEHCFGWRYGDVFVLFVDSDLSIDSGSDQRECIESELESAAATSARVVAAAFHKPPRVEWWFGGILAFTREMEAPWIREDLEPLLESYGVDIVFNGHNHLFAYTPETDGGITWVTTGGGGGMLDTRGLFDIWRVGTWPEITDTIHEHHFLWVTLDADGLWVEAIDLDGDVLFDFEIDR